VTIAEADQDRRLPERLREELPGILAWAVKGAQAWYREGLQTSGQIRQASERYKGGEDLLGQFIAERCSRQEGAREPLKQITAAFNGWSVEHGERPISSRALGHSLEERGFRKGRGSGNVMEVEGLRLHG